jgi:nitroreductase
MIPGSEKRVAEFPVEKQFLDRWSPRAMSGEPMPERDLMSLFEAGRWAPSSYNNQPWRMLYALRESAEWSLFFDLLVDANKTWCKNGAALVLFLSKTTFDYNGQPSISHSFDCGAAWMSFALEGSRLGYVVHGMQGFDYARARESLDIPEGFQVEAMVVVGKPGRVEDLPPDAQKREAPNDRRKVADSVHVGPFPAIWRK